MFLITPYTVRPRTACYCDRLYYFSNRHDNHFFNTKSTL